LGLKDEEKEIQDCFELKRMELDERQEKTQQKPQLMSDKLQKALKAIKDQKKFDNSNQDNGHDWLEAALSVKKAKVEHKYVVCSAKLDKVTGIPVASSSDSESSEVDQPDGTQLTQRYNGGMGTDFDFSDLVWVALVVTALFSIVVTALFCCRSLVLYLPVMTIGSSVCASINYLGCK
jgi:hypothetical protein